MQSGRPSSEHRSEQRGADRRVLHRLLRLSFQKYAAGGHSAPGRRASSPAFGGCQAGGNEALLRDDCGERGETARQIFYAQGQADADSTFDGEGDCGRAEAEAEGLQF